jgi:hypothetical protein
MRSFNIKIVCYMVVYITDVIPKLQGSCLFVASSAVQAYLLATQIDGKLDTKTTLDKEISGDKKVICSYNFNIDHYVKEDNVVLMDAKWIVDAQRGWSQTAWLNHVKDRDVWIITPKRLKDTFIGLLKGSEVKEHWVRKHESFSISNWNPVHCSNQSLIYCFSQSDVEIIAREMAILHPDFEVVSLHGGMDLTTRSKIKLNSKKLIVVTTDVFTVEYNVAFLEVVFVGLIKYDGCKRRRIQAEEMMRMIDVSQSRNVKVWNANIEDIRWLYRLRDYFRYNETYRIPLKAYCVPLLKELETQNGYMNSIRNWIQSFVETEFLEMGNMREIISWAIDMDKLELQNHEGNWGQLLYSPKRYWHTQALKSIIEGKSSYINDCHFEEWKVWFKSVIRQNEPLEAMIVDTVGHSQVIVV